MHVHVYVNLCLIFCYCREKDITGYKCLLESPTSATQRIEEDRVTYLNKGNVHVDHNICCGNILSKKVGGIPIISSYL